MAEPKSWTEIVLMPLAVALVGIGGTYLITTQQERNADVARAAQIQSARELALADRQVKILEIFAEKVTSTNEEERLLALRLLRALDGDLATKLATAVSEGEPAGSVVGRIATQIARESALRADNTISPRVYLHIQAEEDRTGASVVAERLEESGFVVPGIERRDGPASSELRYFRRSDATQAKRIQVVLQSAGVEVTPKYVPGYEQSRSIRPLHFELWFAQGEPGAR